MKKIVLHGALGKHIGQEEWLLDVSSVGEAMRAIEVNTKKLYKYLSDKATAGIKYRVVIDREDHKDDFDLVKKKGEEYHIIPVFEGYKAGVRIVIGVILLIASFYTGGGTLGPALKLLGWSLVIGGVTELIIGTPKLADLDKDNERSFLFNSQVNTTRQGGPVPLKYGIFSAGSQLFNFYLQSRSISDRSLSAWEMDGGTTDEWHVNVRLE